MTVRRVVRDTLVLSAVWELITVILRFGFELDSTRDTAPFLSRLTFGLRIHHGYIGLVMLVIAWFLWRRSKSLNSPWVYWLLVLGGSFFISDMVHHFLVMWPITGSPHFDWVYPY